MKEDHKAEVQDVRKLKRIKESIDMNKTHKGI